jgi:hypothetical protein
MRFKEWPAETAGHREGRCLGVLCVFYSVEGCKHLDP